MTTHLPSRRLVIHDENKLMMIHDENDRTCTKKRDKWHYKNIIAMDTWWEKKQRKTKGNMATHSRGGIERSGNDFGRGGKKGTRPTVMEDDGDGLMCKYVITKRTNQIKNHDENMWTNLAHEGITLAVVSVLTLTWFIEHSQTCRMWSPI